MCWKVHKEVKSTMSGHIAFQTSTTLLVKKVFLAPSALVLYNLYKYILPFLSCYPFLFFFFFYFFDHVTEFNA